MAKVARRCHAPTVTSTGSTHDRRFRALESVDELRQVLPTPHRVVADKTIDHIDDHCRSFVERSPFVLIATSDGDGHFDISPKGDPPGFVQILDERTLAIPERPGNQRADTFTNVIAHPHVGLIFLVPGVRTTLRVAGRGYVTDDEGLRESMALDGPRGRSVPDLALVVEVEEAMLHCAKCVIRSNLWTTGEAIQAANAAGVSGLAAAMRDHTGIEWPTEKLDHVISHDEKENLY